MQGPHDARTRQEGQERCLLDVGESPSVKKKAAGEEGTSY